MRADWAKAANPCLDGFELGELAAVQMFNLIGKVEHVSGAPAAEAGPTPRLMGVDEERAVAVCRLATAAAAEGADGTVVYVLEVFKDILVQGCVVAHLLKCIHFGFLW